MPQHLLNGVQVRAVFQQMHRKRMAQRVGRDVLGNARQLLIVLDDLPKTLAAHTLAVHVDKQRRFLRVGDQLGANLLYVVGKRLDGGGIKRNDALLPFALAADKAGAETHILLVQVNELTDADAGGIEKLQHRVVAVALRIHALRLVEKQLDLLVGEDLRELALHLHGGNALDRIALHFAVHL